MTTDDAQQHGRVHQLSLSDRGMPKLPVPSAEVAAEGLVGDRQRDRRYHGGPERAVSLFSLEVIERVAAEGHPIAPGSTGENVTLAGLDWARVEPGSELRFAGGVRLQVTSHAQPCPTIGGSFTAAHFDRIAQKVHPGESRLYTRVLTPGTLAVGEAVTVHAAS